MISLPIKKREGRKSMNKLSSAVVAALLAGSVAMNGCGGNGNLFGGLHEKGTGDTAALLSDAQAALANREFNNAKAYYESILMKEPDNAQALYGAASATMGTAGLDLGQLLANVVTSNSAAPSIAQEIRAASFAPGLNPNATPDSLLYNIDIVRLNSVLDKIICYLLKIHAGATDGGIERDDPNVMIGLGVACLLRAVARPLDAGLIDITTSGDGKSYDVVLLNTSPTDQQCTGLLAASALDVVRAYQALSQVAVTLGLVSGDTLVELQIDLQEAFTELKSDIVNAAGSSPTCDAAVNAVDLNDPTALSFDGANCLAL
jgi:hypothetical protein